MLKLIKCQQSKMNNSSWETKYVLTYEDTKLDKETEKELLNNLALFQIQMMIDNVKFEVKAPLIEVHIPLSGYQDDPQMEIDLDRVSAEWDWEFKQFYKTLKEDMKN
ncbi:hypothetical protein HYG87_01745 [Methanobacterium alkalithermotolerans]|uniref:Uncharacterized protein n=1 Tax=Methanobacterium alkalithermotolerans TaxID=2731220 RepID=A0A8T8K2C1_9EURY|nr:hypothetical protein [Methanobacterium alkalithermotolerans]QUH22578.1 hypothetical protein HYG87_01745 [Methanobacterium alkalithermotolerans]